MPNYFIEIEELDRSLNREDNCARLREAWHKWNKRSGVRAQNQQNLIREALSVFEREDEYRKYLSHLTIHELKPMLEVALSDDGSLTSEQEKRIVEHAVQQGLTEAEVKEYMHVLGVNVTGKDLHYEAAPSPSRVPGRMAAVFSLLVVAFGLIYFVWKTSQPPEPPANLEVPQTRQPNSSSSKSPQDDPAHTPQVLAIEFPPKILGDGRNNQGRVSFRDLNGDLQQAHFSVVQAQGTWTPFDVIVRAEGQVEGFFGFTITCRTTGSLQVTYGVTLSDKKGKMSTRKNFSFTCVHP